MTIIKPKLKRFVLTTDDYRNGYHHRIDVVMHQREEASVAQNGCNLEREEYNRQWAELWGTNTWHWCNEVIACAVCQEQITDCLLRGLDPYAPPPEMVEFMRKHKHHIRSIKKNGTWLSKIEF